MKRFAGLFLACFIGLAIYYDLTVGTLPGIQAVDEPTDRATSAPSRIYVEIEVHPGDTVLSIIERHGGIPDHLSIEEVIYDFSELNGGQDPLSIQPGEIYKFPIYRQKS